MAGKCLPARNSFTPGKFEWNFRYLIFQIISVIDGWGISCELAPRWMSLDLTDDKSTLVQVMAWCRQATSHYLNQCWPRSPTPYGVTRPQWVKAMQVGTQFISPVKGVEMITAQLMILYGQNCPHHACKPEYILRSTRDNNLLMQKPL